MRIFCSLPVPRSLAETCTMPFASMSKVTSICGTPRGAGGMPTRSNLPRVRFWLAISRSPCRTWMDTAVWLSEAVEKVWLLRVGMVVLRSMSLVNTPPRVSMPRESGRDVQEEHVLDVAAEDAALDGGAHGHHLVGVDALAAFLAEDVLHDGLHRGDAGGAAHEDDVVDILRGEPRVAAAPAGRDRGSSRKGRPGAAPALPGSGCSSGAWARSGPR